MQKRLSDYLYYEEKLIKIYCGDSREIIPLLDEVDFLFTSPPYCVDKEYEKGVQFSDHLSMIEDVVEKLAHKVKPGKILCWNIASNPQRNTILYHGMILEKHFNFVDNIVWRKLTGASPRFGNYVLHSRYYPNTVWEMIFVYAKGEPDVKGSMALVDAMEFRDDVWVLRSQTDFKDHPAPFPIELPLASIQLYTQPGDMVLDPFLGSGTTCVAARSLNRQSIGIELTPAYCEICVHVIRKEPYKLSSKNKGLFNE